MHQYDKFQDKLNMSKLRISTEDPHIEGIDKSMRALISTDEDTMELRKMFHSRYNQNPKEHAAISIVNIDEHCSFLDFHMSLEPMKVDMSKEFVQTIKVIFEDDGELICTPWMRLCVSDGGTITVENLKSFTAILGYSIIERKIHLVSKYVKDVQEHSFLQRPYICQSKCGNIAIALTPKSGIFVATDKY